MGGNWAGGAVPANSLTTDIANFDQSSYAFQPNAGTTSINGLQVGDGTVATATLTVSGTTLSIGGSGINMAANSGPVTISAAITIGAAQTWDNDSASLLAATGAISTGNNVLTISGSGSTSINSLSGTAGVLMSGPGTLTVNNTLTTASQLFKVTGGNVFLDSARNTSANIEVDGGILNVRGSDRYSAGTNHQTFTLTGGQAIYVYQSGGYGIRLNGDNGSGSGGNAGITFTATQTGGVLSISGGTNGNFNMGSTSANDATTYNLSNTGVLRITNGSNWSIGADTAGTSVTAFNMGGGKLLVSNGMSGTPGTGARQCFVWTGGTLATSSYDATHLTSGTGIAVSATSNTLANGGGTLAPGDIGTSGKTSITGNYAVTSTNAVLSIDIGGATQASAFQDSASKYDTVSVSGTVTLNGTLAVYLTNGYAPSPASTFTILNSTASGTALSGSFSNVAFGGRMTTTDGLGSFMVNQFGNAVVLSNFIWLGTSPQISTQPQSLTVIAGKTATFSVGVVGAQPFSYQWYQGSTPISTGTLPWLAIANTGTSAAGSYTVVVSNTSGSVTSNSVTLMVNAGATGTSGMIYDMDQTPVYGTNAITDTLGTTAGTFIGSPLPPSIQGATAYTGQAWDFSSGGANVMVGSNSFTNRLGDIYQTTGMTVGMWVNLLYEINRGLDNSRALTIGGGESICSVATSNGSGAFQFTFDGVAIVSSGSVLDGNWHHVVASIDYQKSSNNVSLYVDGKNVSNTTSRITSSFSTGSTTVDIGNRNTNAGGAFVGALDQAFVYDRALTVGEVSSIYSSGTLANMAPMVVVDAAATTVQSPSNSTTVYATVTDDGLPNPPGTLIGSWSKVSTPSGGSVIFSSSNSLSSGVTFSGTGTYVVRYTASDGQLSNYGDVTINVVTNHAPVIDSCVATPRLLSDAAGAATVTLTGAATDDGLPNPPGILTTQWTQTGGPATVTIAYPSSFSTTASVPAVDGTYTMRFSAYDGVLTTATNVTFVVVNNFPPAIIASADSQAITWPANSTVLRATVTDDGNPNPPESTTVTWQQVSGPAMATLSGSTSANCPVAFPTEGQYVFQASAFDGALTTSATTYVTVWSPGRPIVLPGSSRSLWLPSASCTLSGTLLAVSGSNVPVQWSVVSGSGGPASAVTFGTPNALTTTASFGAAGEYWIQLSATDGGYSNSSRLAVEVYDPNVAPGQYGGGNFGYTGANAAYLASFTGDLQLPYNFTGLDWSRLKPPPPTYVHPRILFNPDDLPDIRGRLANVSGTNTEGPVVMNTITTTVQTSLTNEGAPYNQVYNDLASGITSSFATQGGNQQWIVCLIGYEAFRCLITNDTVGGAEAGAALASVAAYTYPILVAKNSNDWQGQVFGTIYAEWMGFGYDFAYNFMTPAQQAIVRQTLTLATTNAQGLGINAIPAFHTNTSNWNQWNGFYLVIDTLATEGETGADPNLLPRIQANFERLWSMGIFPDGSEFEGMGKGCAYADSLIALAKRGIMIAATTGPQNHAGLFYPACMETTGYGFTWDEWDAGNGQFGNFDAAKLGDIAVLKYLFPGNPVIDFVHRNELGITGTSGYLTSKRLTTLSSFPADQHEILSRAICSLDFNHQYDNQPDPWNSASAGQLAPNLPLTQFFNNHGLVVTRTDWTSNGMRLMFQPRTEPGGHAERDRDVFMLSALGRIWIPYGGPQPKAYDYSIDSSVPRIDNMGPSSVAAKMVDFFDSPTFTYAAGDATIPYSWSETTTPAAIEGWNYNQMLLNKSPQPWANLQWGILPNWDTSIYSTLYWVPNIPVQRAFRTAAMVRGTNSYAIIADDLQEDGRVHGYTDRMVLASDLTKVTVTGSDAIVTSGTGNTSMLMRVLRCSGSASISSGFNSDNYNVLDVSATTVAPNYILMLYPYNNGTTQMPTTTWVGNVVYVTWPNGQVDHIGFAPNADGRTRVNFAHPTTDTSPPVITVPSNIVTTATSAQGNAISFVVSGSDTVDGVVPVGCTPPSGSVFQIGTTTVLCTATDSSLNSTQASFNITVQPGAFSLTAPSGLVAVGEDQSAALSWNSVPAAASYTIYRSVSSGSFGAIATNVVGGNYTDSGLTNGTTYNYYVSAVNGTGVGPVSSTVTAIPRTIPPPWLDQDIGTVGLTGSSGIFATGTTSMSAAGTGVGGNGDSFHFTAQPWTGNCTVVAHFLGFGNATNNSKAGIMLRQSMGANAANAFMNIAGYANQYSFSYRSTAGGGTTGTGTTHSALPQWLKLVLSGSAVTAYDSGDALAGGQTWVQTGTGNVMLSSTFYAGLAIDYSTTNALVSGTFNNFAIYSPPVITVPPNVTVEATGSNGAQAAFLVSGSSNVDGMLAGISTPSSGSVFPLGTTPIMATVTDSAGDVASGTFTVTVHDTTPPAITVPSNITATATTGSGDYVTFATTALDLVSGSVPTANVPASGSFFQLGTTTINVTATDGAGNHASSTFTVTMLPMPPSITSATSATGTNGFPFGYQITASNSPSSYNAAGLPAGLNVNTTTGAITGTPSVTGTFAVTISGSNAGGAGSAGLAITLLPAPPVITGILSATATKGSPFTYQITASNNPMSFDASGLPPGLGITMSSGLISGTATVTGTSDVSISASNAGGTGSGTLTITVTQNASIPAMPPWAVALLGLMLIALAYPILRARTSKSQGV